ncbi:MAG: pyrroline-5-carboxylate reductase [Desulfurobacteriaceae bacterium]
MNLRVGFIGGGNMAEAFIDALINGEFLIPSQVFVSDISKDRLDYLSNRYGIKVFLSNLEVVSNCDVVFLAVKPQVLSAVLREVRDLLTDAQVLVSMAAGYPLRKVEGIVGDDKKVVRIMPNILVKVRRGVIAYCDNKRLLEEDRELVKRLLSATGKVIDVEEKLFDSVTAVSGSSPAFFFAIVEAMCDGAVFTGMPRDLALELIRETVAGCAEMLKGEHPEVLKDKVTSPAGTTIAGLRAFEKNGGRFALIEAVDAAFRRSREITRLIEESD